MMRALFLLCALASMAISMNARAHKASDSYLTLDLSPTQITGHWDVALRDLDAAIAIDQNDDGAITFGEMKAEAARIRAYAFTHFSISHMGKNCLITPGAQSPISHTDGFYSRITFSADCAIDVTAPIVVGYTLLTGIDPQHRAILALTANGATVTRVLDPNLGTQSININDANATPQSLISFAKEGLHHISIGLDHILFVVLIVIGTVRVHGNANRAALKSLIAAVTAFTVAHSITLGLAVFGVVNFSPRWTETLIAATVTLTAIDVIVPFMMGPRWAMTFAFGLVHGLGLATGMSAANLTPGALLTALFGFNIGVELGQLAIASAVWLLMAWLTRSRTSVIPVARRIAMPIAVLSLVWVAERASDQKWLPL